jgi:hypothetical protein
MAHWVTGHDCLDVTIIQGIHYVVLFHLLTLYEFIWYDYNVTQF